MKHLQRAFRLVYELLRESRYVAIRMQESKS
jgi:hypothetical protein